jgi:hypothetical protein
MHRLLLVLLVLLCAAPVTAGPILLGTNTLNLVDDLTVIKTSSGETWEWLDLTSTLGLSVAEAVDAFAPLGFHWATGVDVAELYGAFGFPYLSPPVGGTVILNHLPEQTVLMDYIGITRIDHNDPGLKLFAATGWIDDLTTDTHHTFSCISNGQGACSPPQGEVRNMKIGVAQNGTTGTYLVRTTPVPEPSTSLLLLVAFGAVAGCGSGRRGSVAQTATDGA